MKRSCRPSKASASTDDFIKNKRNQFITSNVLAIVISIVSSSTRRRIVESIEFKSY